MHLIFFDIIGFAPISNPSLKQRIHSFDSFQLISGFKSTTSTFASTSTSLSASNKNEINPLRPGSIVALVTPFLPNGDIDITSLRNLLQYHIQAKTDGLCVLGTTGEASLLSMEERELVLKTVVEEVKGTIPILVGTGSINPNETKIMTQQAIDLGADANLVVTPPYIKPPQRGLIQHFVTMADLGLPLIIYNVPGRTGVDFTPQSIGECYKSSQNIIGVKEATGDVSRVQAIRDVISSIQQANDSKDDRHLLLYSGDDSTEAEFVLQGGDGCISVTANVAPSKMVQMMKLSLEGNRDEAMKINAALASIHTNIFVESNPIPAKWCLKRMGKIESAFCRPPLAELDEQHYSLVEESLKMGGCL